MKWNDEKQQLLLDGFFQRGKSLGLLYYGLSLTAGILLFIAMMLFVIPFQIWEGDYKVLGNFFLLELMGMELYVKQYCEIREDGKSKSIYEALRYLPVSRKQFARYILKKLLKLCLCLTGTAAACQVVFAMMLYHTCSLANLLMPLIFCLVLPMLLTGSTILWRIY